MHTVLSDAPECCWQGVNNYSTMCTYNNALVDKQVQQCETYTKTHFVGGVRVSEERWVIEEIGGEMGE